MSSARHAAREEIAVSGPTGLEFRIVGPWCRKELSDFFAALRAAGDELMFHPHPLDDAAAAERAAYQGKDYYCVAVDHGQILAYGMLRGWDQGFAIPSLGIAVHPGHRGAGIGKAMMHALHAAARARGATRIRLKVHESNARARQMYEHLGYSFDVREGDQLVGILLLT